MEKTHQFESCKWKHLEDFKDRNWQHEPVAKQTPKRLVHQKNLKLLNFENKRGKAEFDLNQNHRQNGKLQQKTEHRKKQSTKWTWQGNHFKSSQSFMWIKRRSIFRQAVSEKLQFPSVLKNFQKVAIPAIQKSCVLKNWLFYALTAGYTFLSVLSK